jgi:hypothetical protein
MGEEWLSSNGHDGLGYRVCQRAESRSAPSANDRDLRWICEEDHLSGSFVRPIVFQAVTAAQRCRVSAITRERLCSLGSQGVETDSTVRAALRIRGVRSVSNGR